MNFDATGDTFKGLLTATRTYQIPRFQRDFSWDEKNYDELLRDLKNQIEVTKNNNEEWDFNVKKYYLGNMIFLGTRDKEKVEVVDGQQRLTTGTILLASIRDSLRIISTNPNDSASNYANTIQSEYLIKKIDGSPQRKLETLTSYPYFADVIQDEKSISEQLPKNNFSNEEDLLKKTYEYFNKSLSIKYIQKYLFEIGILKEQEKLSNKNYINYLKSIRDSFLESEIVEIFVADKMEAHKIFENINSKGKPLDQVDLIKNDIFSNYKSVGSVDTPLEIWKNINKTLSTVDAPFNEYFLNYWKVKYPSDKATGSTLYKKYLNRFNNISNNNDLKKLLFDLENYSNIYIQILNPSADNYKKQEYKAEYRSLDTIKKFRGTQILPVIMGLFVKRNELNLKQNKINRFLTFIANFHFIAYGTSIKLRGNRMTKPYKDFNDRISNAKKSDDVYESMDLLKSELCSLLNKDEFVNSFTELTFSKKNARKSIKNFPPVYAIKTIANSLDNRTFDDDEYTIEHIIDEENNKVDDLVLNVGNLIVLERKNNDLLNEKKKSIDLKENINYKKVVYKKSSYVMTNTFFDNYNNFNSDTIINRSEDLANQFWNLFIK